MQTRDDDPTQNLHFTDPSVKSIKPSSEKEEAHVNFLFQQKHHRPRNYQNIQMNDINDNDFA